jgi:hypothetical protein
MKISWRVFILLSFGLFISFIGYMVVQIFKDPAYQHELVTPNYYHKEQSLNELIQAKKNAQLWHNNLTHTFDGTYVLLGPLPKGKRITISGYCRSEVALDFTIETETTYTDVPHVKIPIHYFGNQGWEIHLDWKHKDSLFNITYPFRL